VIDFKSPASNQMSIPATFSSAGVDGTRMDTAREVWASAIMRLAAVGRAAIATGTSVARFENAREEPAP